MARISPRHWQETFPHAGDSDFRPCRAKLYHIPVLDSMGCLKNFRKSTSRQIRRDTEAGEPTGAREQVYGPGVILTAGVKGAREGARVKIMPVGRPQTAGRASRSGEGRTSVRRGDFQP